MMSMLSAQHWSKVSSCLLPSIPEPLEDVGEGFLAPRWAGHWRSEPAHTWRLSSDPKSMWIGPQQGKPHWLQQISWAHLLPGFHIWAALVLAASETDEERASPFSSHLLGSQRRNGHLYQERLKVTTKPRWRQGPHRPPRVTQAKPHGTCSRSAPDSRCVSALTPV